MSASESKDKSASPVCCRWTPLEKNFALLVLIIVLINLNIMNMYHHPFMGTTSASSSFSVGPGGIAGGIAAEDLDLVGKHWLPAKSREELICMNLDSLIKKTGEATMPEKDVWAQHSCSTQLKGRYQRWKAEAESNRPICDKIKEMGNIVPGATWGSATPTMKRTWQETSCDCHYETGWNDDCLHGTPPAVHNTTTLEGIERAVAARTYTERLEGIAEHKPVVSMVVGTTSRGFRWKTLDDSPLFKIMLPSIPRTLEAGFEYRIYIGYDLGDLFYDKPKTIEDADAWLETNVLEPARKLGFTVRAVFLRYNNVLRKPGPMFNFLAASAFKDGADYVYRVNDDTEFRTAWAGAFVTALAAMHPPNVGVIGPKCPEGNWRILTHDFVHKTHFQIFQVYYPIVLTDWWMDDWISRVYPQVNTMRHSDVWVTHHTWMSGHGDPVRYKVDHTHQKFLTHELRHGFDMIERFKAKHCASGVCQPTGGSTTPVWTGVYDADKQIFFESLVPPKQRFIDGDFSSDSSEAFDDESMDESEDIPALKLVSDSSSEMDWSADASRAGHEMKPKASYVGDGGDGKGGEGRASIKKERGRGNGEWEWDADDEDVGLADEGTKAGEDDEGEVDTKRLAMRTAPDGVFTVGEEKHAQAGIMTLGARASSSGTAADAALQVKAAQSKVAAAASVTRQSEKKSLGGQASGSISGSGKLYAPQDIDDVSKIATEVLSLQKEVYGQGQGDSSGGESDKKILDELDKLQSGIAKLKEKYGNSPKTFGAKSSKNVDASQAGPHEPTKAHASKLGGFHAHRVDPDADTRYV